MALVVENPPANTGDIRDVGLIPGLGRFPEEGSGNPLQYFCLGNPMNSRACELQSMAGLKESDKTEVTTSLE